ncbi:MAG: hypothetical protein J6T62_10280 [Fibrobacter sp.]|nr:hypothetical protein [Fibrobacter sp.]
MKFVLSVVAIALLCSCAGLFYVNPTEKIYSASEVKVDYFEEWGLIRSTGYEVVIKGREKIDSSEFFFKKVCGNLFGHPGNLFASRLAANDTNTFVECFYRSKEPINTDDFVNWFDAIKLNHINVLAHNDSLYHVLYGGDSIQVVSGAYYNHKKVCAEKDRDKCVFDKDFEKKRDRIHYGGPFYEISLPATGAVRSLTVRTNPKDLKGYKPLKIDPAILPLESPGYKKLREQEESLGKRF